MSELTIEQLVKIIIGMIVVVAVILGIYFIFKNNVIDFFKNIAGNSSSIDGIIFSLLD
jgi:hypothetical protein